MKDYISKVILVAITVVVVLAIIKVQHRQAEKNQTPANTPPAGQTPPPPQNPPANNDLPQTYQSSANGFSIHYPEGFTVNEKYTYLNDPSKNISGVSFTIPSTMATGTNLSPDTNLSVEQLPKGQSCTPASFLQNNVSFAKTVTENGVKYSMAEGGGAAAGNHYDEIVYVIAGSSPCRAIRYFIHSTAVQNYPEGTVKEFDKTALVTLFDKIRQSLVLK